MNPFLVEEFLQEFIFKLGFWGLLFRSDRTKNTQTLLDLEISVEEVKQILKKLSPKDFVEGPNSDTMYGGPPLWVFGKEVKGKEMYIKITLGAAESEVICISFHRAEYPLKYPLKI